MSISPRPWNWKRGDHWGDSGFYGDQGSLWSSNGENDLEVSDIVFSLGKTDIQGHDRSGRAPSDEDLAYLLRAVNCFDELVAVCAEILPELSVLLANQAKTPDERRETVFHHPLLIELREIIAKATGEKP